MLWVFPPRLLPASSPGPALVAARPLLACAPPCLSLRFSCLLAMVCEGWRGSHLGVYLLILYVSAHLLQEASRDPLSRMNPVSSGYP